jgi:hypothetical protein
MAGACGDAMDCWLDFAFGVKAVERDDGRPEAGKRGFLAGLGGYFQNSATELMPK